MSFCQDRATSNSLHKNLVGMTHRDSTPHRDTSQISRDRVEGPMKCNGVEVRMIQMAFYYS